MRTASATDAAITSEVRRRGTGHLVGDVIRRFTDADGSSHTRALGYQGMFAMLSGFIGLVGLASVLGVGVFRDTIIELSKSIAPGPSGQLLQEAARRSTGGGTAALVGLGVEVVDGSGPGGARRARERQSRGDQRQAAPLSARGIPPGC